MTNQEKLKTAFITVGSTSFFTGAMITVACAWHDTIQNPGVPTKDLPYDLDFNSAAGKLHTSALILGVVGGLMMLAFDFYFSCGKKDASNSDTLTDGITPQRQTVDTAFSINPTN